MKQCALIDINNTALIIKCLFSKVSFHTRDKKFFAASSYKGAGSEAVCHVNTSPQVQCKLYTRRVRSFFGGEVHFKLERTLFQQSLTYISMNFFF